MSIVPIETIYKGYRFRSRLEARWAVFFDALGVPWEYEKEGFDLGEMGWYLPDFWLPVQKLWAEVKPKHLIATGWNVFTDEDLAIANKCGALAMESSDVVLLTGPMVDPWTQDASGQMQPYLCFTGDVARDHGGGWYADDAQGWCVCPICGAVDIVYRCRSDRCYCGHYQRDYAGARSKIEIAYAAARQARFEHGESGDHK